MTEQHRKNWLASREDKSHWKKTGNKKGYKCSDEAKQKLSAASRGDKNAAWKGDQAGYRALHIWVERRLGKPRFCEECGNRGLEHRQYHWSNISGKYIRDLNDWQRLCVKCHVKYDMAHGRWKISK